MTEEFEIDYSPLCQSITREGKTVKVLIYKDEPGGWILEVEDAYGNSTVWEAPFLTDKMALEEVMRAINDEGIDSLIGPDSGMIH